MRAALSSVRSWLGRPERGDARGEGVRAGRVTFAGIAAPPAEAAPIDRPGEMIRAARVTFEPPRREPEPRWAEAKLRVLASLWGEGFLGPGGAGEVLLLAKPLGLNGSHSVLQLGAGLGGPARALALEWGAWVTGLEPDAELAALGAALSAKVKLEKKAEVLPLDPGRPAIRAGYFHHALSLETFWRLPDKATVASALVSGVKPQGQLVLTELVLGEVSPSAEKAFAAWSRLESVTPFLTGERTLTTLFGRHGLDIRIVEDITARHVSQTLSAWASFVQELRRDRPAAAFAARIVDEAERCMRRVDLMRSGRLRLVRWHAIRR
ncbi:MAG: hypothetical protein SNJ73_01355 [Acetobacteraceae bacterium]